MSESDDKQPFLAVDDYGMGGIWFLLLAPSENAIRAQLPTIKVWASGTRPDWMTDEFFDDIANGRTYDLDDLPRSAWMDKLRGLNE
jgi:hypothetical protein